MRIFISAGEASGDIHGANLIHALKARDPSIEIVGFGGDQMEAAGCRLIYPLTRLAVMFFLRVLLNIRLFMGLLKQADDLFRDERPDAVVLIDYPGFNWQIAKRAKSRGIPVYYFVAPQLWAWAGWRVKKMKKWVDHVLCSLPFEEAWYRERGVEARYIGHPFFDELKDHHPDEAFLAAQSSRSGLIVGLLPGSRDQEIERNLSTLIETARRIHAVRPDVRFLVACLKPQQAERVIEEIGSCGLPLEVVSGKTPEVMRLAYACVAVSGSVSLELMHHRKPTVVVYRISWALLALAKVVLKTKYITLVNILAGKAVFPEYPSVRCEAEKVSGHVLRWLTDPAEYEQVRLELAALEQRVGSPGACDRAAEAILQRPLAKAA